MLIPPIDLVDISFLFAVGTIVLLITAELSSPHYGPINLIIDRKRLKNLAITIGIFFMATVLLCRLLAQ